MKTVLETVEYLHLDQYVHKMFYHYIIEIFALACLYKWFRSVTQYITCSLGL